MEKITIPVILAIEGNAKYRVDDAILSEDHKNVLANGWDSPNGWKYRKFSDIRYTYKGEEVRPSRSQPFEFSWLNLNGVDFNGHHLQYIQFKGCDFMPHQIMKKVKLTKVSFAGCRLQSQRNHQVGTLNLERLFKGSFETLADTEHRLYGHVYWLNEVRIICGCRFFTIRHAVKHWSNGSRTGGPEFAAKMVAFAESKLKTE